MRDASRHTGVMHPAFLYLPGSRLTLCELSAARLDGDVIELGEGYIPADLVEGVEIRAASLAMLIPSGCAAAGPTAAWIHGAGSLPPPRQHARRAVSRRIRPDPDRRVIFHDTPVSEDQLRRVGALPVTTPERTMVDLALWSRRDPTHLAWIRALELTSPGLAVAAADAIARMQRVPGARHALDLLGRADQDEVTR